MLSYILQQAQQFERDFGIAPDVVYINPQHFEALFRDSPELFAPDQQIRLGFRLVILPSSQLAHPTAARHLSEQRVSDVAELGVLAALARNCRHVA